MGFILAGEYVDDEGRVGVSLPSGLGLGAAERFKRCVSLDIHDQPGGQI